MANATAAASRDPYNQYHHTQDRSSSPQPSAIPPSSTSSNHHRAFLDITLDSHSPYSKSSSSEFIATTTTTTRTRTTTMPTDGTTTTTSDSDFEQNNDKVVSKNKHNHHHNNEHYEDEDEDDYDDLISKNANEDNDTENTEDDDKVQSSLCKKCNLPISEGHAYELGDDHWHTYCFKCSKCDKLLGVQSNFLVLGTGALVCSECSYSCKNCGKKIDDLAILTGDQAYCSACFCCRSCKNKIEDLRYARTSKGLFCMPCHERLSEKKRRQDMQKKLLLQQQQQQQQQLQQQQQQQQQRPQSIRTGSTDRKSVITQEMLEKNLPEIPPDSSSTTSSLGTSQPMPNSTTTTATTVTPATTANVPAKGEQNLEVILDIPARSPNRGGDAVVVKNLAPAAPVEHNFIAMASPQQSASEDLSSSSTSLHHQQQQHVAPALAHPPIPAPYQRSAAMSPSQAANRKATILDSTERSRVKSPETTDKDSFIEMDINFSRDQPIKQSLNKGLNIENVDLNLTDSNSNSNDFLSTPNKNSYKFGQGSPNTTSTNNMVKSPTRDKIAQGITRSLSIKSPKKFFHRHKRSISGSLDLNSSSTSKGIILEEQENDLHTGGNSLDVTPKQEQQFAAVYRTPPIPTESMFAMHSAGGHTRAISDTSTLDMSNLQIQSELELRSLRAEIHNLNTFKANLKHEIEALKATKESLSVEVAEERKLLDQLKSKSEKSSFYSAKPGSSSSSVINDYLENRFRTNSSSSVQQQQQVSTGGSNAGTPSLQQPPSVPQGPPRSFSSNNVNDEAAIVQVEDIIEAKPKQKARFWRKPKITKTMISSPSNNNISSGLEETSFVTNLEDKSSSAGSGSGSGSGSNSGAGIMKSRLFAAAQNSALSASSSPPRAILDPKELFGAPLESRCAYEGKQIPFIITRCIEEIEAKGLDIEGIYRLSGGALLVEKLETVFKELSVSDMNNSGESPKMANLKDMINQDIHAVTSLLKRYLRKLPDPIIPYQYYSSFISLASATTQQSKLQEAKVLVANLPELNRTIMSTVLSHLLKIYQHSAQNKMTLKNISVVFGPTLVRDMNPEREIIDMGSRTSVLEFYLEFYDDIF